MAKVVKAVLVRANTVRLALALLNLVGADRSARDWQALER